jgi:probable F420-dependent oxidoreductase
LGTIGLWVGGTGAGGGRDAGALARRAELLGVRALWVGGGNPDTSALDERAEMLAATSELVVATGIVNIWAWEPGNLARRASALAATYPGRFLLGLGVSHRPLVERLGRDYRRPLAAMRAFLDDLDGAGATTAVLPRVLAALGPKMLQLSRDRAGGAHPYLTTAAHTADARALLGPGPLLAPEQAVVVTRDPTGDGRRIARQYLSTYLVLPNYTSNLRHYGFTDADFADGGSDRLVDALVPSGESGAVAGAVTAHLDAGADHVCVQPLAEGRAVDWRGFEELLGATGA